MKSELLHLSIIEPWNFKNLAPDYTRFLSATRRRLKSRFLPSNYVVPQFIDFSISDDTALAAFLIGSAAK